MTTSACWSASIQSVAASPGRQGIMPRLMTSAAQLLQHQVHCQAVGIVNLAASPSGFRPGSCSSSPVEKTGRRVPCAPPRPRQCRARPAPASSATVRVSPPGRPLRRGQYLLAAANMLPGFYRRDKAHAGPRSVQSLPASPRIAAFRHRRAGHDARIQVPAGRASLNGWPAKALPATGSAAPSRRSFSRTA